MEEADHGESGEVVRLDRAECLRLLATVPVGRLIFTVNALPVVRPMNFLLDDEQVVVRTAAGTVAARKAAGSIVAFEADQLDPATASGWSVTVTGPAQLITDPAAIIRFSSLPLVPWAPGPRDQFLTISTELVEGQKVGSARPSPAKVIRLRQPLR